MSEKGKRIFFTGCTSFAHFCDIIHCKTPTLCWNSFEAISPTSTEKASAAAGSAARAREAVAGGGSARVDGAGGPREAGHSSHEAASTDKTESARQSGPVVRASGRSPAAPPSKRRWVPPSFLKHHDVPDGEKHDIIFRKVRGILNKLTPEKFEKLSDDLLGLDLDSPTVLRGVILLIFEKALDEPKYSSMYAQLCRRLSEEAPNFEPPEQPCTFRLLLVNKCRTEFENRANAVYLKTKDQGKISTEDEERLHLAKRKMLGNIKFIGELGKLNILYENILHVCIKELISKRTCDEDLECLAQLVRTCGRLLDTEPGRKLMDQYFARMEHISQNRDLPPRIRFMLRDVIELRRSGWVPRAAIAGEGPVPMGQLRAEQSPPRTAPPQTDPLFRRSRLDHVLAGLTLSPAPTGNLVPPVVVGHPGQNRDGFRHRGYYNKGNSYNNKQQQQNNNNTAPRFNKARIAAAAAVDEVQMRPAANSLLFTANKHRAVAPPILQTTTSPAPLLSTRAEPPRTAPERPPPVQNNKKNKGPNKEEMIKQVLAIVGNVKPAEAHQNGGSSETVSPEDSTASPDKAEESSVEEAVPDCKEMVTKLKELAPPEKFFKDIFVALFNATLESDAIPVGRFATVWSLWRGRAAVDPKGLLEPRPKLSGLLAHLVYEKVWTLSELSGPCEAHKPLMLDVLEQLKKLAGMDELTQMYNDSKIRLSAHVASGAAWEAAGALAAALAKRGLDSLQPSLALSAALRKAPRDPKALYRWLIQNVPQEIRSSAAFAEALVGAILRHGHSGESNGVDAAEEAPDKEASAKGGAAGAKASLRTYGPLLAQMLPTPSQQLAAVYAAQMYSMDLRYPKGVLLQLFIELYELEICERSAFMAWQDDVDDAYPPKGEALFQVNVWLNWLEGQVSSDDEG